MSTYRHTKTGEVREFDDAVIAAHPKAALWESYVAPTPVVEPPQPYLVRRGTIWDRVIAALGEPTALAVLKAMPEDDRLNWFSSHDFRSDNPRVLAMLAAIGLDPAVILAPDLQP